MRRLIEEICDFGDRTYRFALPPDFRTRQLNASAAKQDAWRDWSERDRAFVNELCGPYLERYGYARL